MPQTQAEHSEGTGNTSTAVRVIGGTLGAVVIAGGVAGGTLCVIGTEGIEVAECVKAAGGPVLAGGLVVLGAFGGHLE
jgi:hypothetical protein